MSFGIFRKRANNCCFVWFENTSTRQNQVSASFDVIVWLSIIALYIRYCETRRNVMLEHVYEGYEQELWDFRE